MSLIRTLAKLAGRTFGAWANNELDRVVKRAADRVAERYGLQSRQLVLDAATLEKTNPQKLFYVAEKIVDLVMRDGPSVPIGVAIMVAQAAYEQVRDDALHEARALLAELG